MLAGNPAEAGASQSAALERRFSFGFGDGLRLVAGRGVLTEIPIGASLQRIPNAPAILAGAINVRGAIRLVFDPLRFQGLPIPPRSRRILLLDREDACAGVLIDGEPVVEELRPLAEPINAGAFSPFVRCLWQSATQTVFELDHRAWFSHLRDHFTAT